MLNLKIVRSGLLIVIENDIFMTPFLEKKEEPSRMKKKKKQKKIDGSSEEGTTRIPKKSSLKSVTW